jgi:hypothetical protein
VTSRYGWFSRGNQIIVWKHDKFDSHSNQIKFWFLLNSYIYLATRLTWWQMSKLGAFIDVRNLSQEWNSYVWVQYFLVVFLLIGLHIHVIVYSCVYFKNQLSHLRLVTFFGVVIIYNIAIFVLRGLSKKFVDNYVFIILIGWIYIFRMCQNVRCEIPIQNVVDFNHFSIFRLNNRRFKDPQ